MRTRLILASTLLVCAATLPAYAGRGGFARAGQSGTALIGGSNPAELPVPIPGMPHGAAGAAGHAPHWIDTLPVADEVIVRKSQRRLFLMRDGRVLRSFHVSLGLEPKGAKHESGDFRTPEGHYLLTRRNPRSEFFLSIQVSYPNPRDVRFARRDHIDPGGAIMVHGMPNVMQYTPAYYSRVNWTDGCIALSDADMLEVWLMTRKDTPILILP